MKLLKRDSLIGIVNNFVIDSPTTSNISYVWNIGSMLGMVLIMQILSGLMLGFHYVSDITLAFDSIEHIHRDVWYGAFIRYMHSNGAAIFFILVYLHIGKGLYYGGYRKPRVALWNVGIVIYVLMMATAFLGYVLPYGVMSYWGAAVITSMFSAIPFIGSQVTEFIWGSFSVDGPTLTRFYALHFILPFILLVFVVIHIIYLHDHGSSNQLGVSSNTDKLPFHPYFVFKDIIGFVLVLIAYCIIIAYVPNILGHSDNYIPADPLVTPASIVPEFYFLPLYAILRAIPNKLLGVLAMLGAILVYIILPYIDKSFTRSNTMKPLHRIFFWIFIANFLVLGWLGGEHATTTYVALSQFSMTYYFSYLLIILPGLGILDNAILSTPYKKD